MKNPQSAIRNPQSGRWRLWLLAACMGIPLLGFGVAGALWLHQRHWLGWAALAFLCGEALALSLLRRWSQRDGALLPQPSVSPPREFSPRDEAAWKLVHQYQERIDCNEIIITSLEQFL